MHYLVVGLGNIGEEYHYTRHNIGFRVVDTLANDHNATFETARLATIATMTYKGRKVTLLKPSTYMNHSGRAVRYWLQTLKIPIDRLLVINDDLHIPFGYLRLRTQGSHGGHNGLRNIIEELNTSQYSRLRFGVDRAFAPGQQSTYVLSPFTHEEEQKISSIIEKAADMVRSFCWREPQYTTQRYKD